MEATKLNVKAPELPALSGKFFAVYLEPIMHSGERITIAIAAETDKERAVVSTLTKAKLTCMFGSHAPGIQSLIDLSLSSLKNHIYDDGHFMGWTPPFAGITTSKAYGWKGHSIETLLNSAIRSNSSLYEGGLIK